MCSRPVLINRVACPANTQTFQTQLNTTTFVTQLPLPGDHSVLEPLDSISNSTVKRYRAYDRVGLPMLKSVIARRLFQNKAPLSNKPQRGFVYPISILSHLSHNKIFCQFLVADFRLIHNSMRGYAPIKQCHDPLQWKTEQ